MSGVGVFDHARSEKKAAGNGSDCKCSRFHEASPWGVPIPSADLPNV
jgi:hypothetical protein